MTYTCRHIQIECVFVISRPMNCYPHDIILTFRFIDGLCKKRFILSSLIAIDRRTKIVCLFQLYLNDLKFVRIYRNLGFRSINIFTMSAGSITINITLSNHYPATLQLILTDTFCIVRL